MGKKINILDNIEIKALNMRKNILEMAFLGNGKSSHIGGGLSIVDIVATLYFGILRIDNDNPLDKNRDRFILSKGHGVLGFYTALFEKGLISRGELMSFNKSGTFLFGHPIMNKSKGIEFSNGSLGMGLSLGVGVALSGFIRKLDYKVYVLLGDGECNEGSIWEAVMSASHFNLRNIIAIVDKNNLQQTGSCEKIMSMGDLSSKWRSFDWNVIEVDGHNIKDLYNVFCSSKDQKKPLVIIANTVKGKGFSFTENNNSWHHGPLTKSQYNIGIEELNFVKIPK
tara:strand:- start:140 stop:985 length:846 start_codon:yes stop_codon:yes gene_type:complete